jgi:transposase
MKTLHNNYCNSKQGYLPLFLSDCLDLLDPVLTFDRLMGGIDLNKYLTDIPEYTTGRLRYNPVNMLKTVLFGFMTSGYCSLRELEDNCKVNIRFMYLMDHQTPSYRTFGYFINENYKAFIIEERENTQSCKIISLDKISDEELLKEIHDYQKKCGKAGMIIYDSKKEDKRQCFDGDKTV